MPWSPDAIEAHNQTQRRYYHGTQKHNMLPRDTRHVRRQFEHVLQAARATREDEILEVGCGMGRLTLPIARRGYRIEGLDLSPYLLGELEKARDPDLAIPLHCADIMAPPASMQGRFNVAVGFFVLHHFHDLAACFRGVRQVLKPGGRVVFLEPNAFNPLYYLQVLLTPGMTWEAEKGIARMRRDVLFHAMTSAGFVNMRIERYGFLPPFIANTGAGGRIEEVLEKFPLWRGLLPYQLFIAELPAS